VQAFARWFVAGAILVASSCRSPAGHPSAHDTIEPNNVRRDVGQVSPSALAHVPKASPLGVVALDPHDRMVMATSEAITVGGQRVLALTNGSPQPEELDGPGRLTIRRLRDFLERPLQAGKSDDSPVTIAIDPELDYKLLLQVISSALRAGVRDQLLIVAADGQLRGIPIFIPARASIPHDAVGLVVTVTTEEVALWSLSMSEGTVDHPKVKTTVPDELQSALEEIETRRWGDRPRNASDRTIVLMADGNVSVQRIVDILSVLRTARNGHELFPDVLLSLDFQ
jgi:biopolymer transport protein ExbD